MYIAIIKKKHFYYDPFKLFFSSKPSLYKANNTQEIFCVKSLTLKIQQVFGVKCLPEE